MKPPTRGLRRFDAATPTKPPTRGLRRFWAVLAGREAPYPGASSFLGRSGGLAAEHAALPVGRAIPAQPDVAAVGGATRRRASPYCVK